MTDKLLERLRAPRQPYAQMLRDASLAPAARIARRNLVWVNAIAHSARQLTEAFPWQEPPRHLIRDRDAAYGRAFHDRIRAMGIGDHPTAPKSPW